MQEQPSATDLAWAAGLFEGEGCFNVGFRQSGKIIVQARLAMTDRDVVERFAAVVQVGHLTGPRKKRVNEQLVYEWATQWGPGVLAVIQMLSPWFGNRRSAKALEVKIAAERILPYGEKRMFCRRGHPYEGDNVIVETSGIRRCRICRITETRERMRKKLGITADRYRIKE